MPNLAFFPCLHEITIIPHPRRADSQGATQAEITANLAAVSNRLRVEMAIQRSAEELERQVPALARLQAARQTALGVEKADEQAEAALGDKVKSLAEESVVKRAEAVVYMSKVSAQNVCCRLPV